MVLNLVLRVRLDRGGMAEGTWSVGAGLEVAALSSPARSAGSGARLSQRSLRAAPECSRRPRSIALDAVLSECPGEGHSSLAVDLTDLTSHQDLVERAVSQLGEVYVLAHTAAVLRRRSDLNAVSEEDWDFQLDTNLKTTFFLCRTVATEMAKAEASYSQGGRIILFSSQGWWTEGSGARLVTRRRKAGSSR